MLSFISIAGIALGIGLLGAQSASEHVASKSTASSTITGAAFSAIKSTTIVRTEPDGTLTLVRQGHESFIARDAEGRMLLVDADHTGEECGLPMTAGRLPACDKWNESLYDPTSGVMWHWCNGDICDKTQLTQMDLLDTQIAEMTSETTSLEGPIEDSGEPNIKVESLGEKKIEGIAATGLRKTVTENGRDGKPQARIHEVWRSEAMGLIVMVIDGPPKGEQKITSLLKVSLAPDADLFKPPTNRINRHWKDSYRYANEDIAGFAQWPVKSTGD